MAEPYLTELQELAKKWHDADARVGALECGHFFSGAAAYRDGEIVASLTPDGLAFKVPTAVHDELLGDGLVTPLHYFSTGPIKRNYVLFPTRETVTARDAARLVLGESLAGK